MSEKRGSPTGSAELRCRCGRLLARLDSRGVVLKCPRCKREALLDLERFRRDGSILFDFHG